MAHFDPILHMRKTEAWVRQPGNSQTGAWTEMHWPLIKYNSFSFPNSLTDWISWSAGKKQNNNNKQKNPTISLATSSRASGHCVSFFFLGHCWYCLVSWYFPSVFRIEPRASHTLSLVYILSPLSFFFLFSFETESHCVTQADFNLELLPPQHLK